MPHKIFKLACGTTAQCNAYAGPDGELIIDTDNHTVVVQTGSAGGMRLATVNDITNADVLMTQNVSTANATYPVLLCPTADASANQGAKTGIFASSVQVNPSTGVLSATNIFGYNVAVSASDINVSDGATFTKTISAATTFTFSGAVVSRSACFSLILTNGGAYTVTWPASVKWAGGTPPTLTASGIDVLTFLTHDGGTTWYGVVSLTEAS